MSGLRDVIYAGFREFSAEPFWIFLDTLEIRSRQDWELRLRQGLRTSRVLLVCLSPNYLNSGYCRWEWEDFARVQARRIGGGDAVTGGVFRGVGRRRALRRGGRGGAAPGGAGAAGAVAAGVPGRRGSVMEGHVVAHFFEPFECEQRRSRRLA